MANTSLYWDDFERRVGETVEALAIGANPPVRRVAVFVTDRCNFKCSYCNHAQHPTTMTRQRFEQILADYGDTAIIHITGGEPSCVPWLYDLLRAEGDNFRFHLNTNAFVAPPAASVRRLKVSLDSVSPTYWNELVGVPNAWSRVVSNIREASTQTVTSVTYTLTKQNYKAAPKFASFAGKFMPDLYATFFSIYKGTDPRFVMDSQDADYFFDNIRPFLLECLDDESRALFNETCDEKRRLLQGVRFEQTPGVCYLSMSERVIAPDGTESCCSHLYRDGLRGNKPDKAMQCAYGCNQRLVEFNREVEGLLKKEEVA